MQDKELYAAVLGIHAPWKVVDVVLDVAGQSVEVRLAMKAGTAQTCPECGKAAPGYDTRERKWRHLDTCQYQTVLVAAVPRIECTEHGVRQIRVPWAEEGSRFTALFEALAIHWMKEASLSGVKRVLQLTWDELAGIQERAVRRGLARRQRTAPRRLGIDETSFAKRHEYVTVISDQDTGAVIEVADGRGRDVLETFYKGLTSDELAAIESVAMDMWDGYIGPTLAHVPDAKYKLAFDKFHIAKHLGDAVDRVRRQESKTLAAMGDSTLTGTRYLWLKTPSNMTDAARDQLDRLREGSLITAKAWYYKEWAMGLWHYTTRGWANRGWNEWYRSAIHTALEPIRKVARTIKRHQFGIVNAVVLKVTNARAEGLNSGIQRIKAQARGFRNRARFRMTIYFHFGQLDLYPAGVATSFTHTNS